VVVTLLSFSEHSLYQSYDTWCAEVSFYGSVRSNFNICLGSLCEICENIIKIRRLSRDWHMILSLFTGLIVCYISRWHRGCITADLNCRCSKELQAARFVCFSLYHVQLSLTLFITRSIWSVRGRESARNSRKGLTYSHREVRGKKRHFTVSNCYTGRKGWQPNRFAFPTVFQGTYFHPSFRKVYLLLTILKVMLW
jgi:hypothetical protein